jgi:hypothetical protein
VGILTAGEQAVEMLGEDGKFPARSWMPVWWGFNIAIENVTWTFARMAANARQ